LISDGQQQSFSFRVSSSDKSIASGSAEYNKSLRRYAFSYVASSIGALQVFVSLATGSDLLNVPGSPFVAESLVGPSCASLSSLSFLGSQMVVGQNLQFKITSADDFGNAVSIGRNFFRVTVTAGSQPFSPSVIDNLDGSYSTSFQLSSAGNISITAVRNGFHVSGSPFSSAVAPGPASGPWSMISVQTPSVIAGESFRFSVASADRFGNALTVGGSIVAATLIAASTGAAITVPVTDRLHTKCSWSSPTSLFGATLVAFLSKLLADFKPDWVKERITKLAGGNTNPLNICLRQEVDRFLTCLKLTRNTLNDLKLAIAGTIVLNAHSQLDESNGGEKEHDADDVAVTQTKSVEINGVSVRGGRGYTMHVAK
jgi:hypothetical protein